MRAKNCKECGRLFNYVAGPPLCPVCRAEMEKKIEEVKEYVRATKGATVKMVSEECKVPESQIRQWIREERLVFTDVSVAGIVCETCGMPITTGRYCEKCKTQTMRAFSDLTRKNAPAAPAKKADRESPRMRFLDGK